MRQLSFSLWGKPESLTLAHEARRLLERARPGPELGLTYARIAQEHLMAARVREALPWAEKALPLLERFGLDDEFLRTRSQLAVARSELGDRDAADELRALADAARDPARGTARTRSPRC